MASSSEKPRPLRQRTSTMNSMREEELTRSLKQLSLTTSPSRRNSVNPLTPSRPATPGKASVRNSSTSPRPKPPSRSPSVMGGRDSRAATPALMRKASMTSVQSTGTGVTPSRRTSLARTPSARTPSFTSPQIPEKPQPTASAIAKDFFKADLETNHADFSGQQTETIVILNDAVYGHRFSRPRTSRSALSTIVERPERIKAGVLGISAAYVRLGGRHSEGVYPLEPDQDIKNAPSIPFRIHKTNRKLSLTSQAVTNVHGTKWMEELKIMCESAETKLAMGDKELKRPEMDRGPDQQGPPEKFHEGDLYLCSESLDAMEGALGAVCEGIDTVFGPGPHHRAFIAVRPPGHHCSASYPSGFCWVNNVHVGIMHAALNHGLTHAAIIDFDLHHGDGSQQIAWQHNNRALHAHKNAAAWKKSSIGYFSLHDINSYPCEWGDEDKVKNASLCIDNAHGQTVWNVHLQPWKTEHEFWKLYESKYKVLLEKTRTYLQNQAERVKELGLPPKAAIFFSAGFDASEWEGAGMQRHKVNVPTEFYARLAQDVVQLAAEQGLYVDGRVISVLEGGYSDRALTSGILSHLSGLAGDQSMNQVPETTGLGAEMQHKIGLPAAGQQEVVVRKHDLASIHDYSPLWWSNYQLDSLEQIIANPPSPPRIPRTVTPPNFCTPTQASTAKVVDPTKMRRSLSGVPHGHAYGVSSRIPTPPPPEVDWTVATYELSKLLIPNDRQVDSCRPEDLNAEATRARRDRQSILMGIPIEQQQPAPLAPATERPASRMSLRERKAKPTIPVEEEEGVDKSNKNRRKTVTSTAIAQGKAAARGIPTDPHEAQPSRRGSRRLSGASTNLSSFDEPTSLPTNARPTSSMSIRTQSADSVVQARKNRTSISTSGSGSGSTSTTAARAPRGTKKTTATGSTKPPSKLPSPTKAGGGAGDDVDKITTGMRKIRINLITQSQKEARARAQLEAEKAKATGAAITTPVEQKQPAPRRSRGSTPVTTTPEPKIAGASHTALVEGSPSTVASDPAVPTPPTTIASELSPIRDHFSSSITSPEPHQLPLPASSPAAPSSSVTLLCGTDSADVFIPYQPEGPPPVAVAQQEPLQWLPPNEATPAATPSPMKKKNTNINVGANANANNKNLFEYKSRIPFAPRRHSLKTSIASPQNTTFEATAERPSSASSGTSEKPVSPKK